MSLFNMLYIVTHAHFRMYIEFYEVLVLGCVEKPFVT